MDISSFDIILLFILAIVVSMIIGYNVIYIIDKKISDVNINIPPVRVPQPNITVKINGNDARYNVNVDNKYVNVESSDESSASSESSVSSSVESSVESTPAPAPVPVVVKPRQTQPIANRITPEAHNSVRRTPMIVNSGVKRTPNTIGNEMNRGFIPVDLGRVEMDVVEPFGNYASVSRKKK